MLGGWYLDDAFASGLLVKNVFKLVASGFPDGECPGHGSVHTLVAVLRLETGTCSLFGIIGSAMKGRERCDFILSGIGFEVARDGGETVLLPVRHRQSSKLTAAASPRSLQFGYGSPGFSYSSSFYSFYSFYILMSFWSQKAHSLTSLKAFKQKVAYNF